MPHILITNDDGYQAPALAALAAALAHLGSVTVFAPDHNWSIAGHTKTMHKPLRITESTLPDGTPLVVTSGSPSDCVGLAVLGAVAGPVDLVVSGINQGTNLGQDVTYSGTVAAAMEAAVWGIPAIAASQEERGELKGDSAFAASVVEALAREVLARGLREHTLLNVNFPALRAEDVHGIQVTRLGRRIYRDVLIKRVDPRGRPYYWIGGEQPDGHPEPGTDIGALATGYVSVTPLNLDLTDRVQMAALADWDLAAIVS